MAPATEERIKKNWPFSPSTLRIIFALIQQPTTVIFVSLPFAE